MDFRFPSSLLLVLVSFRLVCCSIATMKAMQNPLGATSVAVEMTDGKRPQTRAPSRQSSSSEGLSGITAENARGSISGEITKQRAMMSAAGYTTREKLYSALNSFYVQFTVLLLVLLDISILLYQIGLKTNHEGGDGVVLSNITLTILIIFMAELALRIGVWGPTLFFKDPGNIADFFIILVSFVLTVSEVLESTHGFTGLRVLRSAYRFLRLLRTIRSLRYMYKSFGGLSSSVRNVVGSNKQRYVDLANQFDLDLCYLNDSRSLIVMSVPATGWLAFFRNPHWEVKRFFETYHANKYRVYNCCPEHPYPDFGPIVKLAIQDHTPPTMSQFVDFLNDASTFMRSGDGSNVVAVHCKGGKGRSGSLCCAWLLYSQECDTPDGALAKFALARTETRKEGKYQGVETPSQKRYIFQLDQLLKKQSRYLEQTGGGDFKALIKPKDAVLSLRTLFLDRMFTNSQGMIKQGPIVVVVSMMGGTELFVSKPILHELLGVTQTFDLEGVQVKGDVKITLYNEQKRAQGGKKQKEKEAKRAAKANKDAVEGTPPPNVPLKKAGKEPGSVCSFIFHTAFTSKSDGFMAIPAVMVDQAAKNKKLGGIKKPFNLSSGSIRLNFVAVDNV